MTTVTYLHIKGTLAENMVYKPRPGYESPRPGQRMEGHPAFQLVLLDPEGRILVNVNPEVKPLACGAAEDPLRFSVRGSIPLHPDAAAYELHKGEIVLYRVDIPSEAPVPAEAECHHTVTGPALQWNVPELSDMDKKSGYANKVEHGQALSSHAHNISYSITAVMKSGQRLTLARGLRQSSYSIDIKTLPFPGAGKLYLGTHDGIRSSEVEAGSIDVPARPPTAHILAPQPYARLPFGQPVSILGCCLEMNGQPCTPEGITWSVDNEHFAAGVNVVALEGLRSGAHRLTLSYGSKDDTYHVETSVTVEIDEPSADYRMWETLTSDA
jgi:hypothetical protein